MMFTLPIIAFYSVASLLIFLVFYRKLVEHRFLYSMISAIGLVLIASELWEVPIFITGFFRIAFWYPYPSLIFVLGHVNIIFISVLIVLVHRPRARLLLPLLCINLVVTAVLTLPLHNSPLVDIVKLFGWLARAVTLSTLTGGFYFGSALVSHSKHTLLNQTAYKTYT